MEISRGALRMRIYLPDATTGFYRGTRFDWSGMIGNLDFAGHPYYGPWFDRVDPNVHDFEYHGADIVAGPCTAATGPAEEFTANGKPLGFDQANVGGTFVKIGVGALRRPDTAPYDPFRLYPIEVAGTWRTRRTSDGVEFEHLLQDPYSGYSYAYRKTVSVQEDGRRLTLDHHLRNTGRRDIQTSVYNHNFLFLDRTPPGPDVTLTFPFEVRATRSDAGALAVARGNQITFLKRLDGRDRVYLGIEGFGGEPTDYDIRIENRSLGSGIRITADKPLSRLALWAIRAPLAIEPFIDMTLAPGEEFSWRIRYDFYTTPNGDSKLRAE